MKINSKTAEDQAVINAAYALCAAIRTAPKACGIDHLETAIITGKDKDALAAQMRKLGSTGKTKFFIRDAKNVDSSIAVVLAGAKYTTRGLGSCCQLCRFKNCKACQDANAVCVYPSIDLGIALGSAVSMAADLRLDNRIMFTVGKAAAAMGLLGKCTLIMGIPLSVSGKSPFFDRA